MKKMLLLLSFFSTIQSVCAQDSIPVSFSQETDTLIKQRFIDRYENVFMTKVPTRQMLKIGYSGYTGAGFRLGYEYKILHGISLEAGFYTKIDQYNFNIISLNTGVNLWGSAKARWYYNMGNRMGKALSASNFSGSYISFSFEQPIKYFRAPGFNVKETGRFGLASGFQSRFFNRGYVDLSLGLFNKGYWVNKFLFEQDNSGFFNPKDFVLTTQSAFGIAIGDWKNSKKTAACEVLLCDEQISDQWKVQLPDITVGLRLQTGNVSVAYEKKIGKSPFSITADVNAWLARRQRSYVSHATYYVSGGLQLRYYYLQKMQIRKGTGGGSFSGPYAGIGANSLLSGFDVKDAQERHKGDAWYQTATLSMGYQQRLFKTLYIDGSVYYSNSFSGYKGGYNVPFNKLYSKISLGFTF